MSRLPYRADRPSNFAADGAPSNRSLHDAAASGSELPLFRFGLRQVFIFVTVFSGLLAIVVSAGGVPALVLIVATLIVAAHVGSTALGSRLRAHADETCDREARRLALHTSDDRPSQSQASGAELPPCSLLHKRRAAQQWWSALVLAGILVGAIGGITVLNIAIGHRTSLAGLAIGALSTAVLGGWVAFLAGNFYGISRQVWNEAISQQRKDEARQLHSAEPTADRKS